ncbi:hypothetical protein PTTG_12185 [Puccinia triticina 1-1 BBBD Race 1]|uniref:Uncharacterized protein n=1 Tax=Puccinia triticina (isolate 1-1 / race 1 (BBBD)) TaxID=630390 RepID=A0A180H4P8_PUCT1|nr:hypothetical protein PTTG_12185 [Puccinia triticina 1-1 BBBD Race 1]
MTILHSKAIAVILVIVSCRSTLAASASNSPVADSVLVATKLADTPVGLDPIDSDITLKTGSLIPHNYPPTGVEKTRRPEISIPDALDMLTAGPNSQANSLDRLVSTRKGPRRNRKSGRINDCPPGRKSAYKPRVDSTKEVNEDIKGHEISRTGDSPIRGPANVEKKTFDHLGDVPALNSLSAPSTADRGTRFFWGFPVADKSSSRALQDPAEPHQVKPSTQETENISSIAKVDPHSQGDNVEVGANGRVPQSPRDATKPALIYKSTSMPELASLVEIEPERKERPVLHLAPENAAPKVEAQLELSRDIKPLTASVEEPSPPSMAPEAIDSLHHAFPDSSTPKALNPYTGQHDTLTHPPVVATELSDHLLDRLKNLRVGIPRSPSFDFNDSAHPLVNMPMTQEAPSSTGSFDSAVDMPMDSPSRSPVARTEETDYSTHSPTSTGSNVSADDIDMNDPSRSPIARTKETDHSTHPPTSTDSNDSADDIAMNSPPWSPVARTEETDYSTHSPTSTGSNVSADDIDMNDPSRSPIARTKETDHSTHPPTSTDSNDSIDDIAMNSPPRSPVAPPKWIDHSIHSLVPSKLSKIFESDTESANTLMSNPNSPTKSSTSRGVFESKDDITEQNTPVSNPNSPQKSSPYRGVFESKDDITEQNSSRPNSPRLLGLNSPWLLGLNSPWNLRPNSPWFLKPDSPRLLETNLPWFLKPDSPGLLKPDAHRLLGPDSPTPLMKQSDHSTNQVVTTADVSNDQSQPPEKLSAEKKSDVGALMRSLSFNSDSDDEYYLPGLAGGPPILMSTGSVTSEDDSSKPKPKPSIPQVLTARRIVEWLEEAAQHDLTREDVPHNMISFNAPEMNPSLSSQKTQTEESSQMAETQHKTPETVPREQLGTAILSTKEPQPASLNQHEEVTSSTKKLGGVNRNSSPSLTDQNKLLPSYSDVIARIDKNEKSLEKVQEVLEKSPSNPTSPESFTPPLQVVEPGSLMRGYIRNEREILKMKKEDPPPLVQLPIFRVNPNPRPRKKKFRFAQLFDRKTQQQFARISQRLRSFAQRIYRILSQPNRVISKIYQFLKSPFPSTPANPPK